MFWNIEPVLSHAGDFLSSSMSSHYAFLRVLYLLASFMAKDDNTSNVRVCDWWKESLCWVHRATPHFNQQAGDHLHAGLRFCNFTVYLSALHFNFIWEENDLFYFHSKYLSELIYPWPSSALCTILFHKVGGVWGAAKQYVHPPRQCHCFPEYFLFLHQFPFIRLFKLQE